MCQWDRMTGRERKEVWEIKNRENETEGWREHPRDGKRKSEERQKMKDKEWQQLCGVRSSAAANSVQSQMLNVSFYKEKKCFWFFCFIH